MKTLLEKEAERITAELWNKDMGLSVERAAIAGLRRGVEMLCDLVCDEFMAINPHHSATKQAVLLVEEAARHILTEPAKEGPTG